jgi:hypothetical protein
MSHGEDTRTKRLHLLVQCMVLCNKIHATYQMYMPDLRGSCLLLAQQRCLPFVSIASVSLEDRIGQCWGSV